MMVQLVFLSVYAWSWMACHFMGGEPGKLVPVSPLPELLKENSGLIEIDNDNYIGLNDSGNEPSLYLFSILRRSGTRTIKVNNAQNVDWEDLTMDDQYIYIADAGNNDGNRRDLTIYRLVKDDVRKNAEVDADKITFSYADQTKFKSTSKSNFDCEALVCYGDSLYLFTKNRGNQKTDLYSIPKVPGNYSAIHLGQYESGGMITSAALRGSGDQHELVLIGYNRKGKAYNGFMIYFPVVHGIDFFSAPAQRVDFNSTLQIESVLFHGDQQVYISNEESIGQEGLIYRADLPK